MVSEKIICDHCGDACEQDDILHGGKHFCCDGCKLVYEILEANGLCTYYNLEENPGIKVKAPRTGKFSYLDDEAVIQRLLQFQNDHISRVTFNIPQVHCASCVWLLENLYKFRNGIQNSVVDFIRKEVTITFDHHVISVRQVVELLASIGYEPGIILAKTAALPHAGANHMLYYRMGVAGFCFGNIMLLSFPEYLSSGSYLDPAYRQFFGYLNLLLGLLVFLFSSSVFFRSAWTSIRRFQLNLDVPLALGILVLFSRGVYEILSHSGAGYMDTLAGLVFFLLVGRWFQSRTYQRLSFERDYRSYFPIAVTKIKNKLESMVTLDKLQEGDTILVRNQELVPADSILTSGSANINYSFVTGESEPVRKEEGQLIYAGGRQEGSAIELRLVKKVSQSYLTALWNHEAFSKKKEDVTSFANTVSRYFTPAIILLALFTLFFWSFTDFHRGINAFTAVLIVACPCALALSSPFTLGNAMRILGRNKLYLKDTSVVEELGKVDHIVFDKTGTITRAEERKIFYTGEPLCKIEESMIYSLAKQSNHPLSRQLCQHLQGNNRFDIKDFEEITGGGLQGRIGRMNVKIGSAKFVDAITKNSGHHLDTIVWVSIDGLNKGYFTFSNCYRDHLVEVVAELKKYCGLSLLSGDKEGEEERLKTYLGYDTPMYFRQSPEDKLTYIRQLQVKGETVLMAGDGLNDAGALRQSNVGIAVSEDINNFSPACDAILDASRFESLPAFLAFCRNTRKVLFFGLAISACYNVVGLYFAIQGNLSPVIAAILMPVSSITVITYGTLATQWLALKHGLNGKEKAMSSKEESRTITNQMEIQLT